MILTSSRIESKLDQPTLKNIRVRNRQVDSSLRHSLHVVLHFVYPTNQFIVEQQWASGKIVAELHERRLCSALSNVKSWVPFDIAKTYVVPLTDFTAVYITNSPRKILGNFVFRYFYQGKVVAYNLAVHSLGVLVAKQTLFEVLHLNSTCIIGRTTWQRKHHNNSRPSQKEYNFEVSIYKQPWSQLAQDACFWL